MDGTGNSRNPIFLAPRGKLRGPFVFSIPKQNRVAGCLCSVNSFRYVSDHRRGWRFILRQRFCYRILNYPFTCIADLAPLGNALTRYYLNVNVTTCVHRKGFRLVTKLRPRCPSGKPMPQALQTPDTQSPSPVLERKPRTMFAPG